MKRPFFMTQDDIYEDSNYNQNFPKEGSGTAKPYLLREVKLGGYGFTRRQLIMFAAINLSLISLALNLILTPGHLWFVPVIAAMTTLVFLIYAISDKRHVLRNIRRSVGFWCLAMLLMQYVLFRGDWAVDYAIPLLVLGFNIYLAVLFVKSKSRLGAVLVSAILAGIHTVYPLVLFLCGYTGGTILAKVLLFTSFIFSMAAIANLGLFWLLSTKRKIKNTLN